jgi:hypothetical protein
MWIKGSLLGLTVLDLEGSPAGRVIDTYPCDGSSPEFAVVRLGHFGEKVLVSLEACARVEEGIQVPYTRIEIEDAPSTESARYQYERVSIARAYWTMQGGERVAAQVSLVR